MRLDMARKTHDYYFNKLNKAGIACEAADMLSNVLRFQTGNPDKTEGDAS